MIAVVGHPDLTAPTLAMLEEELRRRMADFARAGKAGLVRAGQGLPVVFGRAARAAGLALVTVLPSKNGVPAMLDVCDHKAAGELLLLSEQVRLLEYDPADRGAWYGCGREPAACLWPPAGRLGRLAVEQSGCDGPPGGLRPRVWRRRRGALARRRQAHGGRGRADVNPMPSKPAPSAHMVVLSREEALKLLGTVPLGRVAFTDQALPAIRPVNHIVAEGDIIVRTHGGSALLGHALQSEVVAYEADEIDPATRTGWSVVATGTATRVADAAELAR